MFEVMEQPLIFSPQQALNYARRVAQPRRMGSDGERVVVAEITNLLTGFGYHVKHQPFQFIAALHGWIRLELVVGAFLILLILILRTVSSVAAIPPALLLLSLIFLANSLHRWVQASSLDMGESSSPPSIARFLSWLGPCLKSANIIATPPNLPTEEALPHLYFVAHYDSKSQTLPLPIRMAFFALYIFGSLALSMLTLLTLLLPELDILIPYFAWGSLIFGIPLISMRVGNNSPGAIDNASGVGLVLHMAQYLLAEEDLLQRVRMTFLFTAAEEEGLMGATAYTALNQSMLREQARSGGLYILNFDGIGTQGKMLLDEASKRPKNAPETTLADMLREIGSKLDIPTSRFPPIGAIMDHAPFAYHGFDAVSLATWGGVAWSVHTRRDTVDKLQLNGFEQAGRIATKLIQRLA